MPGLLRSLPDRPSDTGFHDALRGLLTALSVKVPDVPTETPWVGRARLACREATVGEVPDRAFDALIEAAVRDPDPSFNRQFVEPALWRFGRRRVQTAIIARMRDGDDVVKAGAARAWYWANAVSGFYAETKTPRPKTREEQKALTAAVDRWREGVEAEFTSLADLRKQWRELALTAFVSNEDLDVRRCVLPGLDLDAANWPAEWHARVAEAVAIARAHADEYIRHRVELQTARHGH